MVRDMDSKTWTVTFEKKSSEQVVADGWQIGPNGDLAFVDGTKTRQGVSEPNFVRAFAAGTWTEVRQYA